MGLGAILILLGIILAVVDIFVPASTTNPPRRGTLLHAAVILIGVGVLVGGTDLALGD